jgi:hypothetical protein
MLLSAYMSICLSALHVVLAATKNCSQAYAGYHFFGGGFYSDNVTDEVGPNYTCVSAGNAMACALSCQEDSLCIKWVFYLLNSSCFRMSSPYAGTVIDMLDADYTSGVCYGSSKLGKHTHHAWLPAQPCCNILMWGRYDAMMLS